LPKRSRGNTSGRKELTRESEGKENPKGKGKLHVLITQPGSVGRLLKKKPSPHVRDALGPKKARNFLKEGSEGEKKRKSPGGGFRIK